MAEFLRRAMVGGPNKKRGGEALWRVKTKRPLPSSLLQFLAAHFRPLPQAAIAAM